MSASNFEYRHPTFSHLLLVGLACSTYLFDPDDVVWLSVRQHSNSASLERVVFAVGALMFLASAILQTWATAAPSISAFSGGSNPSARSSRYFGHLVNLARLLFASALGLLLPLPGALILVLGEAVLIFRLSLRKPGNVSSAAISADWGSAFRSAASKWGLAITMIVFVVTLEDRIAEIGAALSVLVWMALNFPRSSRVSD